MAGSILEHGHATGKSRLWLKVYPRSLFSDRFAMMASISNSPDQRLTFDVKSVLSAYHIFLLETIVSPFVAHLEPSAYYLCMSVVDRTDASTHTTATAISLRVRGRRESRSSAWNMRADSKAQHQP